MARIGSGPSRSIRIRQAVSRNTSSILFRQGGARLPLRERELIAVVVSAQNGCGLCEVHHTNALGDALDNRTRARRIALDHHLAPLTERERALADFAVKVTANPKDV